LLKWGSGQTSITLFLKGDIMKAKKYWILALAGLILVACAVTCRAVVLRRREFLVGLKRLVVKVEVSDEAYARNWGLRKEQLKTDVELKLRLAGIKVVREKKESVWEHPHLIVGITPIIKNKLEFSVFCIELFLAQSVRLTRDRTITIFATTWETGWVGSVDKVKFVSEVREKLKDRVDEFINDYLAANPKEQPKNERR